MRAVLGHCLYRRVIIWAVVVTALLSLGLYSGGVRTHYGKISTHLIELGQGTGRVASGQTEANEPSQGDNGSDNGKEGSEQSNVQAPQEDISKQVDLSDGGVHWLIYKQ